MLMGSGDELIGIEAQLRQSGHRGNDGDHQRSS